ncbi:MAG TPA: LytTR family DNA-binding domain-containing protein [Candidatus Solibacter sp.]|nr:LytTR family DNA-binding domain-containing protein [Candidatus Solibacter sp.]
MTNIRAIIAEDEMLARESLQAMAQSNGIQVVAACGNGKEALDAVVQHRPDLLFLDVQMPSLDGFSLLKALDTVDPQALPVVIFTTAFDQYAVRAFDHNAVDYLLKPFDEERFRKALDRANNLLRTRDHSDTLARNLVVALEQAQNQPRRLAIRSGGQVTFLRLEEIDFIEAAGNYVHIRVGNDSHVLRQTISAVEQQLSRTGFLRIHRSLIVNVDRIRRLEPCGYGEYLVVLSNGKKLSLSRGYRHHLDRFLDEVLDFNRPENGQSAPATLSTT